MSRTALAAVALGLALTSCGGSSGSDTAPSVCGGAVGSTPALCEFGPSLDEVHLGGTFLVEFGLADLEGDLTDVCVTVGRTGDDPLARCLRTNQPGELMNGFFFLTTPIEVVREDGNPLPPGDYTVSMVVGDAAGHVSNRVTAPLRIVGSYVDPGPPPPPPSLGSSNIFYVSSRAALGYEICVRNLEGLAPVCLTHSVGNDSGFSVSADGSRVAFLSDRSGETDLYVMNADGTSQRRLTRDDQHNKYPPTISPDGRLVAWEASFAVHVIRADGAGYRRLLEGHGNPRFSPDGVHLVTSGWEPATESNGQVGVLYLTRLRDGETRRITPPGFAPGALGFLPDGTPLVVSYAGDVPRLYAVPLDGGEPTRLVDLPDQPADELDVAPGGRHVAFRSGWTSWGEIWVVDLETGDLREVSPVEPGWDANRPSFGPDGRQIVFSAEGPDRARDLYVVNLDGSGLTRLPDAGYDLTPVWR